jgi:hypothetical protein
MTLFNTQIIKGAKFSDCRQYRYQLWRVWNEGQPYLNVIGLNPSTADETQDDPTIRRCIDFARQWGYGGLIMSNLFAFRATLPAVMKSHTAPVGIENDHWLVQIASKAGLVLAAWGKDGRHLDRDAHAIQLLTTLVSLHCLGFNGDGTPKHPLYLSKSLKPFLYRSCV